VDAERDVGRPANWTKQFGRNGRDVRLYAHAQRNWSRIKRGLRAAIMAGDKQEVIAVENVAELHRN
jgi:hypothetical protein